MDAIEGIVTELLGKMGVEKAVVSRMQVAGQEVFSISTFAGDEQRDIIGPRGDTIHAIDHLVKKIAEQRAAEKNPETAGNLLFLVDAGDYRTRQIRDIETRAKMMAERARSFQYDVELSPMSAYERLIVHTALAEEPNVKTESQGEGRSRRVVIRYVNSVA